MKRPLLLVGLDAADANLTLRWAEAGHLPAIASLLASGRAHAIENPPGLYTGAVWPSFATGVPVGEHGRYYYRQFCPDSYRAKRILASDLVHEPFWGPLSREGKRVAVVDVPKAPLARWLNGLQLTDWGTHDPEAAPASFPSDLLPDVIERHGTDPVGRCDFTGTDTASLARLRDALIDRCQRRTELALRLWKREPWDLFLLGFSESHCGGHRFWHVHDPSHPHHDPEAARTLGDPLRDVYRQLDRSVGELAAAAGPDSRVLLYLSHGMGPHYDGTFLLDEVLRRLEGHRTTSRAMGLAKTTRRVWHRAPSGVRRLGQSVADRVFERARARDRRGRHAFVVPTNDNCAGIRLNVIGRERHGRVRPGEELRAWMSRISTALGELVEVETGHPVVREIVDAHAVFPGERAASLPDLLVRWNRDTPIRGVESPRLGRFAGILGDIRTGDHRPRGLLVVDASEPPPPNPLPVAEIAGYVTQMVRAEAS